MLSSQSCCNRAAIFLHHTAKFSALNFNPPFFFSTNSIHRRRFHVFAAPIKEKIDLYGHTSSRNLQIEDFLQSVATAPEKLEILEELHRNGEIQTISEFNRLLMSLISSDEVELARKLKSSLSSLGLFPDVKTYSILVNGFCERNEAMEARSVLEEMMEDGFSPNVATFTTLINSFCEGGRVRDAYEVFDIMSKIGCEPTINTFNCLLKGLCYVGRIEEAYALLGTIKKSKIKPDVYTYAAMMNGFCKVGRSKEALGFLVEAMDMGLTPNVVMYNTLFNGYFKEGQPLRGFGLLRKMRERKCKPDYVSYSTLLHGLLKWGKTRAALQVYNEMVGAGYRVDERMMNTLLRRLCRLARKEKDLLDDAYNLFEEMRNGGIGINQEGYELVVEAFCCNGRDGGFEALNEMIGVGFSPKTFTFNIAIHALSRRGEVGKAVAVLTMMHRDRNPRGIPFNALIDELIHQERLLVASCVYGLALKRGVLPKRKPEL